MDSLDFIKEWQECELEFKEKTDAFHSKLLEKLVDFKEDLISPIRKDFLTELRKFFDKYNFLEKISWTQHSCYDEDEYGFICNHHFTQLKLNGLGFCSLYDHINEETEYKNTAMLLLDVIPEISNFMKNIRLDLYEFMFGDHCKVIIYKDKIEVKPYTSHP